MSDRPVVEVPEGDEVRAALQHMHTALGARRVLAEGGAVLNGALIEGGYVDELLLTLSPKVIGGPSQSPAVRWEAPSSRDAIRRMDLVHHWAEPETGELFLRYRLD